MIRKRHHIKRQHYAVGMITIGFALLLNFSSCIEPYITDIDEDADLISVEGSIIKGEAIQKVVVSRTAAMVNLQFLPVREFRKEVVDDLGNGFLYMEPPEGNYYRNIPDKKQQVGRSYLIRVTTPSGKCYESSFERLNIGTEMDSVYYRIEDKIDKTRNALYQQQVLFCLPLKEEKTQPPDWCEK